MQRSKMKELRDNTDQDMFGPKRKLDGKQLADRMKATQAAKKTHQIQKWTQLVLDALNWRTADVNSTEIEEANQGHRISFESHGHVRDIRKRRLRKYMFTLKSLITPINPDDDDEEETSDSDKKVQSAQEIRFLKGKTERERPDSVMNSSLKMERRDLTAESAKQLREERSLKQERADAWAIQTLLNTSMNEDEVDDVLNRVWADPRKEEDLIKTCNSLRAAVMTNTLSGNRDKEAKFLKKADALRNRSDWALS
jgi:hypothetical protein